MISRFIAQLLLVSKQFLLEHLAWVMGKQVKAARPNMVGIKKQICYELKSAGLSK